MKYYKYFLLSIAIILLDQTIKLYVHYNIPEGLPGQIVIFSWLKIHHILNPGMAFGLKIHLVYGKLILTLFRILATVAIAYYIKYLIDNKAPSGLVYCVALILGGAVGNVIDSTFYGVWFGPHLTSDGAITPWFHGKVIDMIYVDIWEGRIDWLPFGLSGHYSFWPIFNIADSSIFVGVAIILLWQRRFFSKSNEEESKVQDHNEEAGLYKTELPSNDDNKEDLKTSDS